MFMVHVMVLQVTQLENLTEQVEHIRGGVKVVVTVKCLVQNCSGCRADWWLQHIFMDIAVGSQYHNQVSVYCLTVSVAACYWVISFVCGFPMSCVVFVLLRCDNLLVNKQSIVLTGWYHIQQWSSHSSI